MNLYNKRKTATRDNILLVALLTAIIPFALVLSTSAGFQQAEVLRNINVGTEANATILGATTNQHLSGNGAAAIFDVNLANMRAHAIATGDVNNDGISDVVTGAPDATFTVTPGVGPPQTRTGAGIVYIVLGKTGLSGTIDTNAGQTEITILGGKSGDKLGFAVAVGDVNGDGIDDISIGAPGADFPGSATPPPAPRNDTGAVFVIFGAASLSTPRTLDLATANTPNVALFGANPGDQFGASVAVGNVGGLASQTPAQQAVKDILAGAPGNNGPDVSPRPGAGAAYVQFGGPDFNPVGGATTVVDLAATPANVVIFGRTGEALGASVAIGDINGGGIADAIVGAPLADRPVAGLVPAATDTGAVYAVIGGVNLNPALGTSKTFDINVTQQNVSVYGAGNRLNPGADDADHLGVSVAASDLTGDGIPDLLIGGPDADGPSEDRPGAGEAYVLQGGASFIPTVGSEKRIDLFNGSATVTVFGGQSGDRFGSTVASGNYNTADNTDSTLDLIVGAPGASNKAGLVSIVFGGSNLLLLPARDLLLAQDNLRVLGHPGGDELGWAIGTADVNNNQGGELIIGAPFANVVTGAVTRTQAGIVYILPSTSAAPPTNLPPTVTVTAPNGGESLQVGQDVDITWTASDPNGDATIQKFDIRLSTDGGTNFNFTIAPSVAGTLRKFTLTVPVGFNTTQGRIRVIVTDNQSATAQDDSNANFTITDIGVTATLTNPNGGQNLKFGQQFLITWTVPVAFSGQLKGFDLTLSTDGGQTFLIQIAPGVDPAQPALAATARSFPWTVPAICVSRARVALVTTSLSNLRTSDTSDADFAISDVGPTIDTSNMSIIGDFRLVLVTTTPAGGSEVVFSQDTVVEISTDAAGTSFFTFSKPGKIKRAGGKYLSKGTINGQDLGAFFPNGAGRVIRITKPTCRITILRVIRSGEQLLLAAAFETDSEPGVQRRVWQ